MAEISPTVLDTLANQYAQALSRLQIAAETAAVDAWYAHNSFDSADDEEWVDSFWPLLVSVGLAVESLAAAYYQIQRDYLGVAPRVTVPNVSAELRGQFDVWGASPPVRARYLVSEGMDGIEALSGAATRVSKLTSAATRFTEQAAFAEMMDSLTFETVWEFVDDVRPDEWFAPETNEDVDRIVDRLSPQYRMAKKGTGSLRWKRVPQGRACGWCQAQASRLLTDATKERDRGWHNFCRCGWRLVTPAESKAWEPMDPAAFNRLTEQRATTQEVT